MNAASRFLTRCILVAILSLASGTASALDPVTLAVLRLLRDQIITSALETGVSGSTARNGSSGIGSAPVYGTISAAQLRGLVDEGFSYLTSAQRDEIYASMQRVLADAQYATVRPLIIEEFARTAAAARTVHEQLSKLDPEEKQRVVLRTVEQYRRLPPQQGEEFLAVLRAGTAPIPRELNDLILAGVAEGRTAATAAEFQ